MVWERIEFIFNSFISLLLIIFFDYYLKVIYVLNFFVIKNCYFFEIFGLVYILNSGFTFGFLEEYLYVYQCYYILIYLFFIFFVLYFFYFFLSVNFILCGILINLFDRILYGCVIDYFYLYLIYSYYIFNLADMFIIFGFVFLLRYKSLFK